MADRFIVVERTDSRVPEYYRDDYGYAIIDATDGSFIGCDGGEPEDQLLSRDWSWVVTELNKAHARGRAEGLAEAREAVLDLQAIDRLINAATEGDGDG